MEQLLLFCLLAALIVMTIISIIISIHYRKITLIRKNQFNSKDEYSSEMENRILEKDAKIMELTEIIDRQNLTIAELVVWKQCHEKDIDDFYEKQTKALKLLATFAKKFHDDLIKANCKIQQAEDYSKWVGRSAIAIKEEYDRLKAEYEELLKKNSK